MPATTGGVADLGDVPDRVKLKIWKLLNEFNQPVRERQSRYDSVEIWTDAFGIIRDRLIEAYDVTRDNDFPEINEEFVWKRSEAELFDVLELWSQFLGSESVEFEQAANQIFMAEEFPWLLVHGRIFRVDLGFVEREVVQPVFAELAKSARFEGALDELSEAAQALTCGDTKAAIANAAKSFESTLKVLTEQGAGTASQLLRRLAETRYFSDLPDQEAKSFPESVFMALPFIRNRLGGHGQGQQVIEVPVRYAQLAVHLAAVLNLFLVRYDADRSSNTSASPNDDDIPF